MKLIYHLVAAAGVALASASALADKPALTVYTYDSFVSNWGPGPIITKAFEATCGCQLKLVGLEDGAALLSRLKMEGKRSRADVILGLDTSLTGEAAATGLLAPHGVELSQLDLAIDWSDKVFLPYDYGHFAFVYDSDRLTAPPLAYVLWSTMPTGQKLSFKTRGPVRRGWDSYCGCARYLAMTRPRPGRSWHHES